MQRPEIFGISVKFCQDGNTLGTTSEDEELTMTAEFQLGEEAGPFFVLRSTTGWSIDDLEDLRKLMEIAKAPLSKIKEVYEQEVVEGRE